jgi:hypothetical protein
VSQSLAKAASLVSRLGSCRGYGSRPIARVGIGRGNRPGEPTACLPAGSIGTPDYEHRPLVENSVMGASLTLYETALKERIEP